MFLFFSNKNLSANKVEVVCCFKNHGEITAKKLHLFLLRKCFVFMKVFSCSPGVTVVP